MPGILDHNTRQPGLLDPAPQSTGVLGGWQGSVGHFQPPFTLMDTWPARAVKAAWGGLTLPGDVYAGKVDPLSDEAIGRAFDLASILEMGGLGRAAVSPEANNTLGSAGGTVLPKKWYHGSNQNVSRFDPAYYGDTTGAADARIGAFLAGSPNDASFYAEKAAMQRGGRATVGEYEVFPKKTLHLSPFDKESSVPLKNLRFSIDDKIAAAEYARQNGYDAIHYVHGTATDAGPTLVLLEPDLAKYVAQWGETGQLYQYVDGLLLDERGREVY